MSGAVVYRGITDEAGLKAIEGDWRALYEEAGSPSPYLDFDWVLMCWRRVVRNPRTWPLISTVWEDGRLVLGLPLVRKPHLKLFRRYYGLRTLLPQSTDGLVAPGGNSRAWASALLDSLGQDRLALPLCLDRLPAASPLNALFAYRMISRVNFAMVAKTEFADGFDAYYAGLTSSARKQYRRLLRQMSAVGPVTFRSATAATLDDDLSWVLARKRAWKPRVGDLRPWLTTPWSEEDLRAIARQWIGTEKFWVSFVEIGGVRAAGRIALHHGTEAVFYVTTFDPQFADFSPGRVLTIMNFEHAANAGVTRFDFMVGGSELKDRVKTTEEPMYRARVRLRG